MGNIFLKLCNMSIAAGWLIVAVILLRVLLIRTPKWIHCLLWGIVAVRLICPLSIESVYSLIPSAETIQSNIMVEEKVHKIIPMIDSEIPVISNTLNPVLYEAFDYEKEESAAPLQIYTYFAGIIWCCGFILLSVYALIGQLRMRHMVKEAVCYRDNIYFCDAVTSPFLLGFIRPRIYLPSGIDEEEMSCVILHEQAHLKRKDHWWKLLGYLLLSVYWFHPLCWAAYIIFCRDIEFACDEKVIKDMTLSEKKEYSRALLSCSCFGRAVLAYPLAFGEIGVKKRIKSVLHYRKSPVWMVAFAVVICVIVAFCFLTNPPYKNEEIAVSTESAETENVKIENAETTNVKTGNEIIEITDTVENNERFEIEADVEAAHSMPLDEAAKMQETIGVRIVLPENENWIKDICYYYKSDNSMEVQYYDDVLEADCTLYAVRDGLLELPDTTFDSSFEENWEGWTSDSHHVFIKVQRSEDGKNVLAAWEYDGCAFAIQTTVSDKDVDIGSVPKTAIAVIKNF